MKCGVCVEHKPTRSLLNMIPQHAAPPGALLLIQRLVFRRSGGVFTPGYLVAPTILFRAPPGCLSVCLALSTLLLTHNATQILIKQHKTITETKCLSRDKRSAVEYQVSAGLAGPALSRPAALSAVFVLRSDSWGPSEISTHLFSLKANEDLAEVKSQANVQRCNFLPFYRYQGAVPRLSQNCRIIELFQKRCGAACEQKLVKRPITSPFISFNFPSPAVHNSITSRPGGKTGK